MTDSIRSYQVWEAVLYAFLNSFPYMLLVLYSFRGHWRLDKRATIALLCITVSIQLVYFPIRLASPDPQSALWDIGISAVHIAFIFAAVKEHIGKLIFTVLAVTNLGTFVVVAAKCLEALFFPELALLKYHYTYDLMAIPLLAVVLPVMYLLVFKDIASPADRADEISYDSSASDYMWHYLWLVPAVFYVIWVHQFHSEGRSAMENAMDPLSTVYLFIIDAGSVLIYRTIVKTAAVYEKNTALLAENHTLSIQRLQYDSLNERLENMRRTRHDIRHHAALLKEIRDSGDMSALDDMINMYTEENFLDQPLIYCENETVNIVLALYFQTAYENNIAFSVKADIPKNIFADKKDLAVLFGNILENAADACKEAQGERFIDLTAAYNTTSGGAHSLTLIVKNSYGTEPSHNGRVFRSSKHPGDGIGISSVKNITEKYGGACSFAPESGIFTVSVILYG